MDADADSNYLVLLPSPPPPILVSAATGPCNGMVCALCLGVDTFGLVNLEQQSNIWARNLIECIEESRFKVFGPLQDNISTIRK